MSKTFCNGVVKWFSEQNGYGFIARDNGRDLFVHVSNVKGPRELGKPRLSPGDQVSFVLSHNAKGECAEDVRVQVPAPDEPPTSKHTRE